MQSGKDIEHFTQRRPDWWRLVVQSVVLKKQGAGAAALYGYPADDPLWQESQQLLAFLWNEVELEIDMASLKSRHTIEAVVKGLAGVR